jgi:phage tail-like protein
VHGSTLYVADAASGRMWISVWMEETSAGIYVGTLAGYRGPVAALAVDESGALFIKPDAGETVYSLAAGAGYAPSGTLTAGPLDAGELSAWDRVNAAVDLPSGATAELRLFSAASDKQPPDWQAAPRAAALDTRLIALPELAALPHAARRFLWMRITLSSADQQTSPVLTQAQAQTAAESYLQYLPAVYRRDDAPTGFLERWLAFFQAALSDVELRLTDMPRNFDPATIPQEHLPWLADWLGFELPLDLAPERARALLSRVHALYLRRGTPGGLADFIELYASVRPVIVEAFHERRVWQLGETSVLGFDTALPASVPDGLIIPGQTWADPNYTGLRGDYYEGLDFARLRLTRTDRTVNFDWGSASPIPTDTTFPADYFSVRWTGQVMARHSETYTFYVRSDDGVRLWVDGQRVIDAWVDQAPTTHTGQIALTAGRWYALTLEYYEKAGAAVIQLAWSSRSQPKEIIPETQLYSVRDERAQLQAADPAGVEPMRVGHTVIGESGPLAAAEFGLPFSSETAHLFTVLVPAAQVTSPTQRQALTRTLEAEKPAHTDYHLCLVAARMRIGFQARLGIDAILAAEPAPMTLAGAALGLETYLGADNNQDTAGRVGQHARLGRDTMMG